MIRKVSVLGYMIIGIIFSQAVFAETRNLLIDHLFVYKNQMVNYRISVKGEIKIDWTSKGFVHCWNKKYEEILCDAIVWNGHGRVYIQGRGNMNPGGGFTVHKINYDSSMSITVNGIQRYMKGPKDRAGTLYVQNLELQENWDGKFNWDIKTSDPENDSIRLKMLKKVVPHKIPDSPHTGKTIEFDQSYLENATYEYVTSNAMGTFRWRYILTPRSSNRKEFPEHTNAASQDNFDDDLPKPRDYPVPEGRLGPPLDQIQWDLVDD